DFERALSHGAPLDGGPGGEGELPGGAQSPWAGVELVYRRLRGVLVEEGLEEIPSEGVPFDPTVHEAVDVSEDANLSEATAARLYRKGYRFKGHVIRAAMVGVARPPETPADDASEVRPVDSGEVVEPVEGDLTDRPGPNDISEMEE
nr:nucleotide exchange factor GrpE [Actinomycetota bacterium]